MGKKKNLSWEKSSQVKEIMESNRPIRVKEYTRHSFWETCVKEHLAKQAREWEARK